MIKKKRWDINFQYLKKKSKLEQMNKKYDDEYWWRVGLDRKLMDCKLPLPWLANDEMKQAEFKLKSAARLCSWAMAYLHGAPWGHISHTSSSVVLKSQ